ncbi:hypothetical protein DB459_24320 [Bradyrhizobium sp. WD16]|nr:hypothetical protein DB459_24320 [Bradyrhizobium sp. WD16]
MAVDLFETDDYGQECREKRRKCWLCRASRHHDGPKTVPPQTVCRQGLALRIGPIGCRPL